MLAVQTLMDIGAAARADAGAIAARQRQRLTALLDAARAGAFYGAALHGRPSAQWSLAELPVMDKRRLMHRFADIVADPRLTLAALREFTGRPERAGQPFLDRYWVWESSGSTGEPGLYVHDDAALDVYDALEALRRDSPRPWARWFDPFFMGERIAFVGATGGHFASHVAMQRLRRKLPWVTQQWRGLSILQPLPELVAALDAFAPTILATYPTAAAMLADEARGGRLRIPLREVWTGGETLTPAVRTRVEQAFGCALRNSYGASEFLPIAWECGHGRLHVNADWVVLEAVDAHHRPVPAGTLSHTTLVTNLANHVQPIIRFDLGDRIVLPAERCPCGSALPVVQVEGRRDDTLVVPGRAGREVPLLPLALSTVLEEEAGAFDFQLQQTARDSLRLCLGPRAARSESARRRCRQALADFATRQGAAALRVTTTAMPQLPLGRTGKLKRIVALPGAQAGARRPG
ncbi:MAG: phenylacetate--CoA ligase family protein [Rubrivivax sp.]|nr:phenylacetate--CoA ligase family protein [Rubrivivax sp.]